MPIGESMRTPTTRALADEELVARTLRLFHELGEDPDLSEYTDINRLTFAAIRARDEHFRETGRYYLRDGSDVRKKLADVLFQTGEEQ